MAELSMIKLDISSKVGKGIERRKKTITVCESNKEDVSKALSDLFDLATNIADHPSAIFSKKYRISIDIDRIYDNGNEDNFNFLNERATLATICLIDDIMNNELWLM